MPRVLTDYICKQSTGRVPQALAHLRESDPAIVEIFTMGGCYQLFLILRATHPQAVAWSDINHVVTEIDGAFYDINGVYHSLPKSYTPLDPSVHARAHRWVKRTRWRATGPKENKT